MEIKIDRKIHEDVRRDIFVKTPGSGRHRCLMGIYQIGKTELVKDWIKEWTEQRNKILSTLKAQLADTEYSTADESDAKTISKLKKMECEIDLEDLPEELKVFCVAVNFKELNLSALGAIFKEIQNKVFKPTDSKTKEYIATDNGEVYQIKTADNFLVTVADDEKKEALDHIAEVLADKSPDITRKIKTFAQAITVLGFHLILVFDEFNNAANVQNTEDNVREESEDKEKLFQLLRELEPYSYDAEGKQAERKYNLTILLVARQEFGMITGKTEKYSKDNEIYKTARMTGFSKHQIEEFIGGLKKIKDFSEENEVYAEVAKAYNGTDKLEMQMLKRCGKHPGLWGSMPNILRYMYAEKNTGNSVSKTFKDCFEQANHRFFRDVVFLLGSTKEIIGETVTISALKVYIHKFIDSTYYIIKDETMDKCLNMMERQGLVICCSKEDSLEEMMKNWNHQKKSALRFLNFSKKEKKENEIKDVFEMHTPYFEDYMKGILYSVDVEDVMQYSEQVEKLVRELINEVYKIKFGTGEMYRMKMLNRIDNKGFWKDSVQRNYANILEQEEGVEIANSRDIIVDEVTEEEKWKTGTALNILSFGGYAGFMKQYSNIFGPAFEKYVVVVDGNYQFDEKFDLMIKKMTNLRNGRAHLDGLDVLAPKDWEKLIALCKDCISQIDKGFDAVKQRAMEAKETEITWKADETDNDGCAIGFPQSIMEKLLDMYDVSFECLNKYPTYAKGFFTYGDNKYSARIIHKRLCRSGRKKSDYYSQKISEGQTVQVDIVEYNDSDKCFIVQPLDRSGMEEQWKKVEDL